MPRGGHFSAFLVVSSIVAACTSFGAAPSSVEVPAGPSTDGGAEATVGLLDAKPDVPAAPTDCTTLSKNPNVVFCDDFEIETDPAGFWGISDTGATGTITIVPDNSGHFVRMGAAGRFQFALLAHDIGIDVKTDLATLDADIRLVSGGYNSATLVDLHGAGAAFETSCGVGAYGTTLRSTRGQPALADVPSLFNTWHHVTISLGKTAAGETRRRVVIDNTIIVDDPFDLSGAAWVQVRMGIVETDGDNDAEALTIDYDNVVVRKN
jgi:hypothetical protein